jgi:hypothetical protein
MSANKDSAQSEYAGLGQGKQDFACLGIDPRQATLSAHVS